ncbi:MAG: acyl-CoA dehydrogenase [Acidiferrobacterales bacterium]|nr:acyl-CoA dehydrogenase [Acidiferrobacterales bacterium]
MTFLIQLAVVIAAAWYFIYTRATMGLILKVVLGALLVVTLLTKFIWLPWVLLLVVSMFYAIEDLRKKFLSGPILSFFRSVLPKINQTELEALEAGDVWWEAELFQGDPEWDKMLAYPKPTLTEEEQSFVDNQTEQLCALINDWQIVHQDGDLSAAAWKFIKEKKFLGMIIPKEYGGLGFSALAHSAVITKLATRSASAAVDVMVPNSLGPGELLMNYGTQAQRDHYLPRLAKGDEIPCFALTSPEAGSDAGALIDKGIVCKGMHEGKEVIGLSLTWNKRYITLAPIATVLGLAFKMFDPDGLLGEQEELGITVALIPTDHPGVISGRRHNPMGMAFMNGPTQGENVFIPLDWIIGGPEFAGRGWQMLVECLSEGRGISLPGLSTATAQMCYRFTGSYSKIRKQFNLDISDFEGVEEALARIAGYTYLLEAMRTMTAGAVDLHVRPSVVSAIAKYHMTELSRVIVRNAMDIHGGRGLILGERNYLAHCYISTPIAITVEGANILTRNLIIFGQGAIRCHPFIFREMMAAQDQDQAKGLQDFDGLIFRHAGYTISNVVRTLSLSLTFGLFGKSPVSGPVAKHYKQLYRMSSALALVSDASMLLLGGGLKRRERLSARLGDVLSQLYMACTVLKYYEDHGRQKDDLAYVQWNVENALFESQVALNGFFENLRNRPIAWILKRLVFPFGNQYKAPDDNLGEDIVEEMLCDNELRTRLTKAVYIGDQENDPGFIIEDAFQQLAATQETRRAIRKAMKAGTIKAKYNAEETAAQAIAADIIDQAQADAYIKAEAARYKAIQVDDFAKEDYVGGKKSVTKAKTIKKKVTKKKASKKKTMQKKTS